MAFVSRYTLGRDHHKMLRARLQKLADKITAAAEHCNYRVFTDSAPVIEVEWAQKSGLGWRGKHTLLLSREAGSMFFLGDIYRYARGCGYTYRQLLRKLHEVY